MPGPITPVSQLGRRMPTAGRLRAGRKGDRGQPEKLNRWRATSHDEQAIRQIAERYGGEPQQWSDPKVADGQWEVVTEAAELPIVLPPDPLGSTPIYEMWSGGGCQRRCDGETCSTVVQGPDGGEPGEVPCICAAKGALDCQVKTRLSVILPEVRFAGVWRIDSSSWNAARELPGMVDMVQALQQQAGGLSRGVVALEERKTVSGGQTRRFMVPVVRNSHSPDEIASGAANLGALHSGREHPVDAPALNAGDPQDGQPPPAGMRPAEGVPPDDVADGEVVEGEVIPDLTELAGGKAKLLRAARALAGEIGAEPMPRSADDVIELADCSPDFDAALRQRLGDAS